MPTPQPQRSAYRDRRINVMLQSEEPASSRSHVRGAVMEKSQPSISRRSLISIAIATAAVCALAMFFLLFRSDTTPVTKSVPLSPVASTPPAVVPVKPPAASVTPEAPAPAPPQTAPAPERVHFKLNRSGKTQTVGGLSLRLLATNVRKGICSVLVKAENAKPAQHSIQVNRPLEIAVDGNPVNVLVTSVSKTSISGYVTGS